MRERAPHKTAPRNKPGKKRLEVREAIRLHPKATAMELVGMGLDKQSVYNERAEMLRRGSPNPPKLTQYERRRGSLSDEKVVSAIKDRKNQRLISVVMRGGNWLQRGLSKDEIHNAGLHGLWDAASMWMPEEGEFDIFVKRWININLIKELGKIKQERRREISLSDFKKVEGVSRDLRGKRRVHSDIETGKVVERERRRISNIQARLVDALLGVRVKARNNKSRGLTQRELEIMFRSYGLFGFKKQNSEKIGTDLDMSPGLVRVVTTKIKRAIGEQFHSLKNLTPRIGKKTVLVN